jgi:hypothetical protein
MFLRVKQDDLAQCFKSKTRRFSSMFLRVKQDDLTQCF